MTTTRRGQAGANPTPPAPATNHPLLLVFTYSLTRSLIVLATLTYLCGGTK